MFQIQVGLPPQEALVLDQVNVPIIVCNSESVLYFNPEAERISQLYSSENNDLIRFISDHVFTRDLTEELVFRDQFIFPLPDKNLVLNLEVNPYRTSGDSGQYMIIFKSKEVDHDELKEGTNRLKTLEDILEHIPADVVLFDVAGRFLYLNKLSVKDDELRKYLIGRTNVDYCRYRNMPLDLGQSRQNYINRVISTGEPQMFEEEIMRNGKRSWHMRYMHPVKDANGDIEYIVGYARNIDKEKQSETFSRIQSMAIEETVDGVALLDNQSNYFYLNKSHALMYGYNDPSELVGKTWHCLYHLDEQKRIEKEIFPTLMEQGTWRGITNGLKKDGSQIITEITLSLVPDGGLICVCRDITEIRRQEMEMKRLALVVSKSSSMVMVTDPEGAIEWVNESFEKVTGYPLQEIKGKRPYQFLNGPETCPDRQNLIDESVNNKKPFSGDILSYFKNGKKAWLHLESTPVFNTKGDLQNFICVSTDISILKEAQLMNDLALKKERELSELKSRFVSLASHEFRTPLASILSSVEIIEAINSKKLKKDERLSVHSDRISSEVQRMTEIMNDILLMGRLEVGRINFKPESTDLIQFTKDQLGKARYKFLTFELSPIVTGKPVDVSLDINLMGHVFMNLLSNAVKYSSGSEKQPEIHLCYKDDFVTVTVKDHGIGIPKNDQEQLFNSFFRASNTIDIPGTGLGLVIVKQFVEMHDGQVSIHSEEGKGCEVNISLPYQPKNN